MTFTPAPSILVIEEFPETHLGVAPTTLAESVRLFAADGQKLVGWKHTTERDAQGRCWKTGYMLVTTTGLSYFDNHGICYRESHLYNV